MSKLLHNDLSNQILAAAFTVHNTLGPGLLESCYEGAMVIELKQAGIPHQRQQVYPLYYKGELVGTYIADLVAANTIILELKAVQVLNAAMQAQLLNYLRLSGCPIGYLLNFYAPQLEYKRFVL